MRKSLKSVLLLTIVALIAVLVIPAAAQDGVRTLAPERMTSRVAVAPSVANPVPHAITSDLLYDQLGPLTALGDGGLNLHDTYWGDTFQFADDFEVPADTTWSIDGVEIGGFWAYNDPTTVEEFFVEFRADDAGEPGVLVCEAAVDTFTVLGDPDNLATVEFATPCELEAGTYWMSAYPAFDSSDYGYFLWYAWYWFNVDTTVGGEAYWVDIFDYFSTGCDVWTLATVCGFSYTDMSFALYGLETTDEPEPEPEVPAVNYPNKGEIMISANTPVYTYGAAGDYMTGLVLPADYDGSGYDTYIVTATAEVAGEMWYAIWVGGEDYVWVPGSQVTVLR